MQTFGRPDQEQTHMYYMQILLATRSSFEILTFNPGVFTMK